MSNPFKENTTSYNDWEVLKDLEWHCTKCELKSGQAKTWQVWRQSGIQLAKDEKDNFYKMQFCKTCDMNTVHRKLESLEILDDTKVRTGIPVSLARKIKIIYKNELGKENNVGLSGLCSIDCNHGRNKHAPESRFGNTRLLCERIELSNRY